MGIITRIEEKIGNVIEMPFQQGAALDPVLIEIALKRLIEAHRKPIFDKTYVYPSYAIILNESFYFENEPFLNRCKELLESAIENWLREKAYETTHPITINFQKGASIGQPFEIHISKKRLAPQAFLLNVKSGSLFHFHPPVMVIGRGGDCHICVRNETVSWKHAQIVFENGKYVLTDLGSRNGTRVNQKKISTVCLQKGDEIIFGGVEFVFGVADG